MYEMTENDRIKARSDTRELASVAEKANKKQE
jgi:hypothetical protein